jgi:hypothetical protein
VKHSIDHSGNKKCYASGYFGHEFDDESDDVVTHVQNFSLHEIKKKEENPNL